MNVTTPSPNCENIAAGEPTFPPVMTIDMFARKYPIMHGASIYVGQDDQFGGVIIAIGHPEFTAGMFMGFTPDQARNIAAFILNSANGVDGGEGRQ